MRNSTNYLLGLLLMLAGILWMLKSLNLLNFYWADLLDYWYWFWIGAGVLLVLSGLNNNRLASSFAGLLMTIAIIGGISTNAQKEPGLFNPFEWQQKKTEKDRSSEEGSYPENQLENKNRKNIRENFGYDMQPGLLNSKLSFSGGVGEFNIKGTTDRLFKAETRSDFVNYVSNIRYNKADNFAVVDFKMENGNLNLKNNRKISNQVDIQLNDQVNWDIELEFGAGEADFDFSRHLVKSLKMKTGVTDVKIRLGDRAELTEVDINAGVASVDIEVPKNAGVEIVTAGALNSTELPGFEKTDKNRYRSDTNLSPRTTIRINYQGGISSLKVKQY